MRILTVLALILVLFVGVAVSPAGTSTGSSGVALVKGASGSTGA
jgi:hypothetical protein